ncbi:hypothetical protein [Bacillus sp. FJAT-45350]|uniref:hypothetical protein n=1 Tax=Bacillus sp. FJAT-45350 TaxID=2011014 RepID=UPI000BB9936A|nr:hypothetical protein [Bacillus sp. FJAT-45350]
MQINIKNIRINSISTIGSLNIGKTVFTDNHSSSARYPKPNYEETEPENNDENENPQIIDVETIGLPPYSG